MKTDITAPTTLANGHGTPYAYVARCTQAAVTNTE